MFRRLKKIFLATTALVPLGVGSAVAGPNGATVVGGSASVQGQGTANVTVTQQSQSAIINWNTFNIGAGESTKIIMPNASSVELDRVTGGLGPSQIYGSLWSNGRVFVVNPDGILIGPGGKIDAAGFLATTHDIANSDFMAGRYNFTGRGNPSASVVNEGAITAQSGGFAALVAPGVRNTGTITATLGKIGLASANGFSLDFYGDRLIQLNVGDSIATTVMDVSTGQPLSALVSNEGKLKANGGRVELTAVAARQVVDTVINNTGVIEANSIGTHNGMIVLGAATAASKPVGAPTQTVKVSGKLSAAGKRRGTTGGTIVVTGENIQVSGANINASGETGGGKVLIGGDTGGGNPSSAVVSIVQAQLEPIAVPTATTVSVDASSVINASAIGQGNGGKVIVWSNEATTFYGTILATGGASGGNGGFVETSGHLTLSFNGTVDTSAANGAKGALLLDPLNATIATNPGSEVITVSSIESALATGNVVVTTVGTVGSEAGDITVAASLSWANANTLTLNSYRNIVVNANITNTGGAAVILRADDTGIGVGSVSFGNGAQVSTAGSVSIFYNPSVNPAGSVVNTTSYVSPTENFTSEVTGGGALTAYMLVNTVYDLQNIQNNLSGTYALGRNIDASATSGWNGGIGFVAIGDRFDFFSGLFDGEGHVIDQLVINSPPLTSQRTEVGLFYSVGVGAVIRNVGLTNVEVNTINSTYTLGIEAVGGLVAENDGTVSNSYVTGNVSGGAAGIGVNLGGLVGYNGGTGTIVQSYSSASVNGVFARVGGLVGSSDGTINNSYANGAVNGGGSCCDNGTGGLIGTNFNLVTNSYSTGTVNGAPVGGLVGTFIPGFHPLTAAVLNSYWDTQASGQPGSAAGIPQITSQLKAGLPVGFDPTVWGSNPSINNGYPYLLWQVAGTTPPATVFQPTMTTSPLISLPPGVSPFPNLQTAFFNPPTNTPGAGSTQPVINNLNTTASIQTISVPASTSQGSSQNAINFGIWSNNQSITAPELLQNLSSEISAANAIYNLGSVQGVTPIDWLTFLPGLPLRLYLEIEKSGFQAGLYIINGKPILAFSSTNFSDLSGDVLTDLENYFGKPTTQYGFAAQLAEAVEKKYPNVTLTGFSLGGGLAAFAGAVNGITAVTFDPAPVPAGTPNSGLVLNLQVQGGGVDFGKSNIGTTVVFNADIFKVGTASPTLTDLGKWHSMSWFEQLSQTTNYHFNTSSGALVTVVPN
jgi:filamentous hemagglutinin family protein